MRRVVEFESDAERPVIGEVVHMFDLLGEETTDRLAAASIVVQIGDGPLLPGEVTDPDGIYTVH